MRIEVEQKFAAADPAAIVHQVTELGGVWRAPVEQIDQYFAHPMRDFATTDEALRIRQSDGRAEVTYKGPKLDQTTKTRHEIDVPLSDTRTAAEMAKVLTSLGFTPAHEVRKSRRTARIPWDDHVIEVALDEIDGLGTYVELELIAEEATMAIAQAAVQSLADTLNLNESERRSYLELLLEQ